MKIMIDKISALSQDLFLYVSILILLFIVSACEKSEVSEHAEIQNIEQKENSNINTQNNIESIHEYRKSVLTNSSKDSIIVLLGVTGENGIQMLRLCPDKEAKEITFCWNERFPLVKDGISLISVDLGENSSIKARISHVSNSKYAPYFPLGLESKHMKLRAGGIYYFGTVNSDVRKDGYISGVNKSLIEPFLNEYKNELGSFERRNF